MDHERFREWFSHVDELTTAQCKEVAAVLSDPPVGAASLAASSWAWMQRRCPHCASAGAVRAARHAVFAAIGQGLREDIRRTHARRCRACTIRSAGWPSAPRLAQATDPSRLPSAAGLRRARRIAGVTASWRRAKRRTGLPSSRRTRPSFSRAGRGSGSWIASRAGAAEGAGRGLSASRAIRFADRRRRDPQPHLARLNAKSVKEALEPVVADALLSPTPTAAIPVAAALGSLTRASTAPPASGFAAPCTSRRSTIRNSQIKGFRRGFRGIDQVPRQQSRVFQHRDGDQPTPASTTILSLSHRSRRRQVALFFLVS